MDDEFVALRSAYYVGNYNGVNKEAKNLSGLSKKKGSIRDSYLCRSLIATKKYKQVKKICGDKVLPCLLAVKQLSIYEQSTSVQERELVMETIEGYLDEDTVRDDDVFCIIASQIYIDEGKYKEALKLVVNDGNNLEKLLLQIQIYLKIYRPDLALKSLKKMEEIEDDDTLTLLGRIWICMFVGGTVKTNEGIERIEDLISTNNDTIVLINMLITANMHLKKYNDAWKLCKKARDIARNDDLDIPSSTLINSIICLKNLNKAPELLTKLYAELKKSSPDHEFIQKTDEMEKLFDKSAADYKV